MRCAPATLAAIAMLAACGAPPPARPAPGVRAGGEESTAGTERPRAEAGVEAEPLDATLAPPPSPCVAAPPSGASLAALGQRGVIRIDASAPRELGACISPALVSSGDQGGGQAEPACDPSGQRCRIGERSVLIARELEGRCVPIALVVYEGAAPDAEPAEVRDALAMRDEACALHDRVALSDPTLYAGVQRARRIAAGARGLLVAECLQEDDAIALATEARGRFAQVPLRCAGLRCESVSLASHPSPGEASSPAPASSLLFANRLSGALRFDGVAWLSSPDDQPRALELLRRRCR